MQNAAGMWSNPSRAGSRQALQAAGTMQVGQGGNARQCCRMMLLPPVVTPLDTAEYRECVRNVPIQSKMYAGEKRRAGPAAESGKALLPPAESCSGHNLLLYGPPMMFLQNTEDAECRRNAASRPSLAGCSRQAGRGRRGRSRQQQGRHCCLLQNPA